MNEMRGFSGVGSESSLSSIPGAVLQVVQAVKTDTQDITSGTWNAITGLSKKIVLKSNSSAVLVNVTLNGSVNGQTHFKIQRDGTDLTLGDDSGDVKVEAMFSIPDTGSTNVTAAGSITFLDTGNRATAPTYSVYAYYNSATVSINKSRSDGASTGAGRYISTITLTEIAQ